MSVWPRLLPVALAVALAAGCRTAAPAQLHVLGVEHAERSDLVVFVQVVNRARRPMRLERLRYTFGAGAPSELRLGRDVGAGSAIVVEVPVDVARGDEGADGPTRLAGRLYATMDAIEQSFEVSALVMRPIDSPAEADLLIDEPATAPR